MAKLNLDVWSKVLTGKDEKPINYSIVESHNGFVFASEYRRCDNLNKAKLVANNLRQVNHSLIEIKIKDRLICSQLKRGEVWINKA